ncbi:MAG: hypothetical protein ACR2RD_05155, partial [Woeseiaceae bacterium]
PASFRVLTYDRLKLLLTLLQGVIHYEASRVGNVPVSHQFSDKPHDGDVNRTYLLPDQQGVQIRQ